MQDFLPVIKPTFPDTQMLRSQVFPSTNLVVIETSFLTLSECACDQFHFLIPLGQDLMVRTENKLIALKERNVFPCNPMQPHKVEDTGIEDFQALVLYLNKTLLQTTAGEMYGHKNLEFNSDGFSFSPTLKDVVKTFIRECRAMQPGYSLILESLSVQAAVLLLRESRHNLSFSSFQTRDYKDHECISKAIEYITDNYQSKLSLFDLASETNYSPYHFLRLFKQHTGRTPFEFLLELKIERAKSLLAHTNHSISEICYMSGFSSNSYFSQIFKKKTGMSPSQFKSNI